MNSGDGEDALGGLVGVQENGTITDSWASARINNTNTDGNSMGSVAGNVSANGNSSPSIFRVYGMGAIMRSTPQSAIDKLGGFVGNLQGATANLTGYWNNETVGPMNSTGVQDPLSSVTDIESRTSVGMQTPTNLVADFFSTTDLRTNWLPTQNRVWDFGSTTQYPGIIFDSDTDGIRCIARPVLVAGNANDTSAFFDVVFEGDYAEENACVIFQRARENKEKLSQTDN